MVKARGISIRAAPAGKVAQPAVAGIKHQPLILTYNDRTVTHLHIKVGRGCRPHRHLSWYSTFAPFPDTRPRKQPALAQTYATVVFGEGRVSGEPMLTVGRGLRTTATAAVGPG